MPNAIVIAFEDAGSLQMQVLAQVLRGRVNTDTLATVIKVYPATGISASELARRINATFPELRAHDPEELKAQLSSTTELFNTILFGSAAIALLIGTFSVVNTMMMAVGERTREIGIRKAIGAGESVILREFLAESAVIGFIGGLIGLALGYLAVLAINAYADSRTVLFETTPRLAVGAVVFSVLVGVLAGFFPAWKAARLDPVTALRYQY